jgi:dephospho-CoA kinase
MMSAMANPGQPPNSEGICSPGLRVTGVLGGVGSGKSTVARLLAKQLPAALLDADQIVAELLLCRPIAEQISQLLGPGLTTPDGILSRSALADRVFGDKNALRLLESVLHPAVRRELRAGLLACEQSASGWAVLDVPLLLENGLHRLCDLLVYVDVDDDLRAQRAMQRHGWSREQWQQREAAQIPVHLKKMAADVILSNVSGVDHLCEQVVEILPQLQTLPPRPLRDRWPSPEPPDFWRPHTNF